MTAAPSEHNVNNMLAFGMWRKLAELNAFQHTHVKDPKQRKNPEEET